MNLCEELLRRRLRRHEMRPGIYGGWMTKDRFGRKVRAVVRCCAPNMEMYRANWEERNRRAM